MKNNRKQKKLFSLMGYILQSILPTNDWFSLIISLIIFSDLLWSKHRIWSQLLSDQNRISPWDYDLLSYILIKLWCHHQIMIYLIGYDLDYDRIKVWCHHGNKISCTLLTHDFIIIELRYQIIILDYDLIKFWFRYMIVICPYLRSCMWL